MKCKGRCEKKQYRFYFSDGGTVIAASSGAPKLAPKEVDNALKGYFESAFPDTDCKKCAADCECVPLKGNSCFTSQKMKLPEPIVATSGSDTYTITGEIELETTFISGICTRKSDPKLQKKPPAEPEQPSNLNVKKKFKPKHNTTKCECTCEIQVYEFRPTDATVVTPDGTAPPLSLPPAKRSKWLSELLGENFKSEYPTETLGECGEHCECLVLLSHVEGLPVPLPVEPDSAEPRVVKISKPIEAIRPDDTDPLKVNNYIISGECEVIARIYLGICVPRQLVLESAGPNPDGHSGR